MKSFGSILLVFSLFFTCVQTHAEIITLDYTGNPISTSIMANDGAGEQNGSLFFSKTGASMVSGELTVSLSALADKSAKTYWSTIELGSGFALAAENDTIDLNTVFTETPRELVSVTRRNASNLYTDYVALRFSNNDGSYLFGWAEISANVTVSANGKQSIADVSVNRFAYNTTANAPITAGYTELAIPEPAVATLILGSGIGLLISRRVFMK